MLAGGHAGAHHQCTDVGPVDVLAHGADGLSTTQECLEALLEAFLDAGNQLLALDTGPGQLLGQVLLLDGEVNELRDEGEHGRTRVIGCCQLLGPLDQRLQPSHDDSLKKGFLGGKMTVNRPDPDPGAAGHFVNRDSQALRSEDLLGRSEHFGAVTPGVRPQGTKQMAKRAQLILHLLLHLVLLNLLLNVRRGCRLPQPENNCVDKRNHRSVY